MSGFYRMIRRACKKMKGLLTSLPAALRTGYCSCLPLSAVCGTARRR